MIYQFQENKSAIEEFEEESNRLTDIEKYLVKYAIYL